MYEARWYPSNVTLSDGHIMTMSGLNRYSQRTKTMEIYDPILGTWTHYTLPFTPTLYPKLHPLSNGRIFYTGPQGPLREYHPATHTWRSFPQVLGASRLSGSSVLLPLVPPHNPADARILTAGGGLTRAEQNLADIIRPAVFTPEAHTIASVMMIRPGAVTHGVDMEQRVIQVSFILASANQLKVVVPPNSAVAPEGHYMLFLVNTSGVPSVLPP